jgi:hypothetical protein
VTSYAPNYTPRARLKYLAAGIEHTIMMRSARGATAPLDSQIGSIRECFNLMASRLADDFAWISSEYALTDSDDFFPRGLPTAVTGTLAVADFSLHQRCMHTNFNGRVVGSRAALYFYGVWWEHGPGTEADNGRATPTEWAAVGSVATELSGQAHAGNGLQAIFHQYANIKVNDHLLKLLRRGTIS